MIIIIYYKDNTCFEGDYWKAPHYKDSSKIFHREGGPAIEYANGTKEWYQNGKLHREDGHAIEWMDGTKQWWLNGKLHRESGPAVEWANGDREWWIEGKELTTLSQEYLIKYMELTGETLTTLILHQDKIIRDSVKKYKWNK